MPYGDPPAPSPTEWAPETEEDREAVRRQMERVLATPMFKNSKRYPNFLRYVVEEALNGRADQLKERSLGIEVFGRSPDYNTSEDHVVRTAAGEVRRRIIQYYAQPGADREIRIELPAGSYAPHFYRPDDAHPAIKLDTVAETSTPPHRRLWVVAATATFVGAVITLAAMHISWSPASPLERFWQPVLESSGPVVVSIGQGGNFPGIMPPGIPERLKTPEASVASDVSDPPISASGLAWLRTERVNLNDAITGWRIASYLQSKGRLPKTQGEYGTDFTELRNGPAVLIGAFNNAWTQRLTGELRYAFDIDRSTFIMRIRDTRDSSHQWVVDGKTPNLKLAEDYAIVSRVLDPTTERMVVVVGGLTRYGTAAAGEFLSDGTHMATFARQAPSRWWEFKHVQVVLATKVINGQSGPPRPVAFACW